MRKGWGHGEDGQDREVHGRGSLLRGGRRVLLRGCHGVRSRLWVLRRHGGRVLSGNRLHRHRDRLALQAGVESPFWDEASLLMGGCEEPWYKKPLTPRRLRLFLKRYGGSLADDAGRRGHAAFVFSDVMHLHGIPLGGGADGLGALYVRRAESVAMTVAFLATGCTLADMAAITGLGEEAVAERITRTWDGDAPGRIYGLAHAAHHDRIPETFASSDDLDEPWDDWICPCRG